VGRRGPALAICATPVVVVSALSAASAPTARRRGERGPRAETVWVMVRIIASPGCRGCSGGCRPGRQMVARPVVAVLVGHVLVLVRCAIRGVRIAVLRGHGVVAAMLLEEGR
jgi:hypothetical protein